MKNLSLEQRLALQMGELVISIRRLELERDLLEEKVASLESVRAAVDPAETLT
jgi:hypothetical protein